MNYTCYNWMPLLGDHCIDMRKEEYISQWDIEPLHENHCDPQLVEDGDIVFVKTDYFEDGKFPHKILPRIKSKFYLVTGVSDFAIIDSPEYIKVADDPKILHWYAANCAIDHKKITPLPIGFQEKEREGGDPKTLDKLKKTALPFDEKEDKIFLPFHGDTRGERKVLFDALKQLPFVDVCDDRLPFEEYMNTINKYKYAFCFEGGGPDVHRNYECILLNTVPVINEKSVFSEKLSPTKKLFTQYDVLALYYDLDNLNELEKKMKTFRGGKQNKNILDRDWLISEVFKTSTAFEGSYI